MQKIILIALIILIMVLGGFVINEVLSMNNSSQNVTNSTNITVKENISLNTKNSTYQNNKTKEIRHEEKNGERIYIITSDEGN
ncbi:hypothetical protein [Methanobacterium sp. ACI-7]|uniref:hypothetical protein n=1 Tax=unclassified Methanobacterium TaxID=2627676 RepID=UPI0039C39FBB